MSTNFDSNVLLDDATYHFGFGRVAGATVSTKARVLNAASYAALAGLVTAPAGSIALCDDGDVCVNTTGAALWSVIASENRLIADPGNAGAIPVTRSGYCPIVTAGAETRTLAAPTKIGQRILVYMKTDGGNCVITCASIINAAGNNTITFADVTDTLNLVAVESGSSLVWRVVSSDGAALSTV
jgi:hypothetical protein